jgi:hypothetical protein
VRARIDRCWRPYHAAVAQAIDAAHARHGYSIHINCHSMPAVSASHATDFPGLVHADFVVGDRDGTTASPALSALVCEHLRGCGYSVEYNHPYKGVELVRRYGNPSPAPPQHPAGDQPQALHGRKHAGDVCATRPPGHHAGADFMGGYCFLNNAAVAAQALRTQGCRRVAVLDVDYHHGNGTQSLFYERADVLFVSLHGDPRTEYPFYLGHADETGRGAGEGFNLNLPLPAGSAASTWFEALDVACARIARHGADALVVSLGLDTFAGDPISTFALQADDFSRLGQRLAAWGCRRSLCWKAAMRPPNWVRTR